MDQRETGKLTGLAARVRRLTARSFADLPFSWQELERAGVRAGFSGAELACGASQLRLGGELAAVRTAQAGVRYWLSPEAVQRDMEQDEMEPARSLGVTGWKLMPDREASRAASAEQEPVQAAELFFRFLRTAELVPIRRRAEAEEWTPGLAKRLSMAVFGEERPGEPPNAIGAAAWPAARNAVLSFFWKAAAEFAILAWTGRDWRSQPERLARWLNLPPAAMEERLYRLWRAIGVPEEPRCRRAVLALDRYPNARLLAPESASDSDSASGEGEAAERERFADQVLALLVRLGWADPLPKGDCELRLPRPIGYLPEEEEGLHWYVLPDFEVIPVGTPGFDKLWPLALFAEPPESGVQGAWKLTEKSWREAARRPDGAEGGLAVLTAASLNGVPAEVSRQLREWAAAWPPRIEASAGRSSETRHPRLPRPGANVPGFPNPAASVPFGSGADGAMGPVPGPDELLPGWREVPAAWYRESRSYHPSTAMKLAVCAMRWKTFLHLGDGKEPSVLQPAAVSEAEGRLFLRSAGRNGEEEREVLSGCPLQILLPDTGDSWYDRKNFTDASQR
ncbi:hypothetical protein [Gorillibacterium sp. sgz500922]|uniref:hypothetical protein n=1 Tax=Gorillibacterium sp. sgz500922 TaxID=3446694 RepID=UPI003F66D4D6